MLFIYLTALTRLSQILYIVVMRLEMLITALACPCLSQVTTFHVMCTLPLAVPPSEEDVHLCGYLIASLSSLSVDPFDTSLLLFFLTILPYLITEGKSPCNSIVLSTVNEKSLLITKAKSM